MSETETALAPQLPAGMTVTTRTINVNNLPEVYTTVTFGSPPRTIEVVDLDMGSQFDLAEITGNAGENLEYRNLAFIAASVRTVDGVPYVASAGFTKGRLRNVLKHLGADGVRAAGTVIAGFATGPGQPASREEHLGTVGNS